MFNKFKKFLHHSDKSSSILTSIENNDLELLKSFYACNDDILTAQISFKVQGIKYSYIPLTWACYFKNLDALKLIHTTMKEKNMFLDLSEAVYVASSVKDNIEVIKYLLEEGANPNYVKNGGSPLWYSCESGDVNLAELLVNHGMDVNIKGTSTFLLCVYSNNISGSHDVLEYLINQYLELDLNESKLLAAVTQSRYDLIRLLVEEDELTTQQISELILIICKVMNSSHVFYCNMKVKPNQKIGNVLICDLLETSGVNINYQDKLGRTILIEACINKNYPLIKMLVLKGADSEIKDNGNYTAKDYLNKKMHHLVK